MNKRIGRVIKRHRLWMDLDTKDFADKVGLTAKYINIIERGQSIPPVKTLCKIADVFGKQLWELIKEAEEMGEQNGN